MLNTGNLEKPIRPISLNFSPYCQSFIQTPAPWTKEGKKKIQELGLKMVVREHIKGAT